MPQPCNCIADFNAKLAPEQELDVSLTFSRTSNEMLLTTYIPLRRKSTGKAENRSRMPRLAIHTHCPFCGISLKGEAPKEDALAPANAVGGAA